MNEPINIPTAPKPVRKRKATTPRAPRVIDPGVAAIRAEAKAKVQEYHQAQASGRILESIIKQVARLTDGDKKNLIVHLNKFIPLNPL